ncbi:NEDD4-binding protein 2-like 2 isoform X2 [Rhineura floridana]|nr:NEDD4-binding protein 2-like 2 isoform X2 [Rhineura floridana]XP_061484418.1 NEDD4-binding protein 2-like 2 isoform X2 [Rhineura floridana]
MLHDERKPKYLESQDVSSTEPSSKRMKSAKEPYGKSYDGLQRLHEEIHIKKIHSGFIPLSLSDDDEDTQEKEHAEVKELSGTKPASSQPSYSVTNTEISENKSTFFPSSADIVHNREGNAFIRENNEGETELYSTSKAFIGPIYKSEADRLRDQRKKRVITPKQALPLDVPKIEDELSQFYNEIDQLESDESHFDGRLQGTEINLHGQPVEYSKLNQMVCVNSQEWPYRTSPGGGGQCFYNESSDHRADREQYPYNDPTGHRSDSGQCCNNETELWEAGQLCNKQEGSRFWNDSVPQFRPSWQHTHPFIIPYGPLPPQFAARFNFQETNSSSLHSGTFHPLNVGPFKNMSSSTSDQNNEYANHFDIHSTQPNRNGCSVPNGHMGNGFCETRPCWKDIKTYPVEGSSNISQRFPEGKLCESQKLLLILRGLPGSGKTTLSRILLGQSRDGIVFSTDDYFRQNNGCWSYNVGQLGAAHDWNQKRAKQAMDQGRSPIIIDNTNTQAWEMKPYVEAALEKGYGVEFHEPNTWWKFDPEELEKRNEHGVSREKIVQMLERYEYQMSIPIIMNSVLPFHKTSQWPPPQRRQRESVVKKKHRLHKMRQRRKRKRNRKTKGATMKTMGERSDGHFTPSDEDSSHSGQEDSEDNRKPAFVTGHLNEPKEVGESGSASDNSLTCSELKKESFLVSDMVDPVLAHSLKMDILAGDTSQPLMHLPPVPNESRTEGSFSDNYPNEIKSVNGLECDNQCSSLKLDHSGTENSTKILTSMEDKATSAEVIPESGLERKLLSDEEKMAIPHQPGSSKMNKGNTWAFFSFDLADTQPQTNIGENDSFVTWPGGASKVMYEQRPKKGRRPKQGFSEMTAVLIDYQSNKELVKERDREVLHGNNGITDCALIVPLTENIHKMPCIEMVDFTTDSGTKAGDPNYVSVLTSPTKKGRCKRIYKLAPNFDIPRQIPVRKDEKVLRDADVLVEQEDTSYEETREKNKQSLCCYECPEPSTYDVIIESSPYLDLEPLLHKYSSQLVEVSMDSSTNVAALPIQICTYASCKASLPSEQQTVAFNQAVEASTEGGKEKMSPGVSTTQPDILCSVKESAAENSEEIQQINETEQTKYSQIKDDQDLLRIKPNIGLPLSLGFALQLVEHFGSPGIPLDTLLPDDYVVSLDWATSKEIYLQWKTSVEKKQNNIVSKENSSLPAGAAILDVSNRDGQERQESSEDIP